MTNRWNYWLAGTKIAWAVFVLHPEFSGTLPILCRGRLWLTGTPGGEERAGGGAGR